jgi:hypothetical protein
MFQLENLKGKSLARPRRGWEDNGKMALREVGGEGVDWIHLVRNRV